MVRAIKERGWMFILGEQQLTAARGIQKLTHPAMLLEEEGLAWLDKSRMDQRLETQKDRLMTICGEIGIAMSELIETIGAGNAFLVNTAWFSDDITGKGLVNLLEKTEMAEVGRCHGADDAQGTQKPQEKCSAARPKKIIHILALGDVGGMVLTGLKLLGGESIERLGIWDLNPAMKQRWEYEMNQTAYPWEYDRMPEVVTLEEEELFHCDVFVFCASKGVPPVGTSVGDVRMAQLEENRKLVGKYGVMARQQGFAGLFAVVSDPVDPLCKAAFVASNTSQEGGLDGKGLRPEQIQGYGLGVMNSRAAYYAKRDSRFASFLTEGRAFGPHGEDLVIANSVTEYDETLSEELTMLAREANLRTRELGFKPFIAPALSSAAISILLTLEGKWHYSSNYLGGVYMGCRNRTADAVEMEQLALPEALYRKLEKAYRGLEDIL